MSGKEIQDQFSSFVNSYNPDVETFIASMKKDHRTLQQNGMRFMLQVIEAMAEVEHTDLRNESGVLTCKRLVESFEKEYGYKPSQALSHI